MKMERRNYNDKEKDEILNDFVSKLVNNQSDIPDDIRVIVNEHFWELLY